MMTQQPGETVADFAHRFSENQHALEKRIPNIHRSVDAGDLAIKLLPEISKDILSRDFNFQDLPSLIEAAKRSETSNHPHLTSPTQWTPNVLVHHANQEIVIQDNLRSHFKTPNQDFQVIDSVIL